MGKQLKSDADERSQGGLSAPNIAYVVILLAKTILYIIVSNENI